MMISGVLAGPDPAIYRSTVLVVMAGSEPGHDVEALCRTARFRTPVLRS
jgi:hypothetical protein